MTSILSGTVAQAERYGISVGVERFAPFQVRGGVSTALEREARSDELAQFPAQEGRCGTLPRRGKRGAVSQLLPGTWSRASQRASGP
ncbi:MULTISPECIES: hypothetical protein [unclassified Anaeromyxobacter]|uniref:hypothetical protein n=1 Tax=unclassified Anaeromyxobacter TaxID=2620896 RepID=UPI001F597989|nr:MULTISPECIES: hypothetical protein [unclassified Anaeromyxobacter]